MSKMRATYLLLAVVGAVLPMSYLAPWIVENGLSVGGLITAWQQNAAATGLFWDLVISAFVLTIWVLADTLPRNNRLPLLAIPATFLIGVSCGLPLFLYLRTGPTD